jgi:hypothetical protein
MAARVRVRTPLAAATAAVALLLAAAAPAHATGYRYWSYWLRTANTWTYAQTGPATHVPTDGSVEGWRFAVSKDASAAAVRPRGAAGFAAICGGTPAVPGKKRVALLIDPGSAADAPDGAKPPAARTACATVPGGASSADALAAVAKPLRYDSAGILCAIGGYPRTGCGEQVAAGAHHTSGSAGGGDSGPSLGLYAGIGAVVLLGAGAVWQTRRRGRP